MEKIFGIYFRNKSKAHFDEILLNFIGKVKSQIFKREGLPINI